MAGDSRCLRFLRAKRRTDGFAIHIRISSDPDKTRKIVERMVPRAFWDYKDLGGWMIDDISWSINPDDWEAARSQLADIIEKR